MFIEQIIQEAQETVRSWGGEFQVIYLPQWERYSAPHTAAPNRDEVLMLFQELGIPVIDMVPVFEAHGDPLSLFPFRAFGHYNESGHQLVSSVLVNRLKSNR